MSASICLYSHYAYSYYYYYAASQYYVDEWSVGLSVTVVSPAKTAEPIDMPFGVWSLVGSRNHVIIWGSRSPCERAILRGKGAAH